MPFSRGLVVGILATWLSSVADAAAPSSAVVQVDTGALRGVVTAGIASFKGIPYAEAPTGAWRWRPPRPAASWTGVRPADRFGARCVQPSAPTDVAVPRAMSEDCLFLNIWTATSRSRPKPVLFWIHGGGSRVGAGSDPVFDGSRLARKGIVVVTINYRLGVLGFLSLPALSREAGGRGSGNYGFMDDIAALRWVRRNIAAFGGDPDHVTIAGESAGSVAVSVLMASPMAKGLFAGAIGESGSAFRRAEHGSMGATTLASEEAKGELLARYEQVHRGRGDLAALRALPASTLIADADAVVNTVAFYNLPVIDGSVLVEAPAKTFAAHRQNDVPLLAGWNATEGSLMLGGAGLKGSPDEILRHRFGDAAVPLERFYPTRDPAETERSDLQLAGDEAIGYPTWAWAAAEMRTGSSPVFLYVFDRAPHIPAHFLPIPPGQAGAFHGAEMAYAFDNLDHERGWAVDADDQRLADRMSSYWAAFVKTGAPGDGGVADVPSWPADTIARPTKLLLGTTIVAGSDPDAARMQALAQAHARADAALPTQP